jgi:hypothetical protein
MYPLLLVIANVPSSMIIFILMMDTMFLRNVGFTRATRRRIPEDGILHSHGRGNLKFYNFTLLSRTKINMKETPDSRPYGHAAERCYTLQALAASRAEQCPPYSE